MGCILEVKRGVFVPRPETELLVEEVVKRFSVFGSRFSKTHYILDLCTGCGNMAIALAKFLPEAFIWAIDISEDALGSARQNAERNGLGGRIEFIKGDLFEAPFKDYAPFDAIVSNPPYIAEWEFSALPDEVLNEPRIALYGGEDGLDFYRRIIKAAPGYLKDGGLLAFEVGYYEARFVSEMLVGFKDVEIIEDYSGIERVVIAKKSNP